jgi:hypothetical protein
MSEPETSPAPAANGKSESVAGLRWHRSLRGRLMLWTSLTSAGLLLLVSLGTYGAVRQILLDNAGAELDALAAQTAGSVQARLEAVMTESRTLVESVHAVGPDPATLRGLLRAVVIADPDVAGAMLILEPEAQGPGSPGFHWYVRREGEGFHEQPMRYEGYDYMEMPWWATSSGLNLPWWSDPYANVATGQHWFATFNQPVHDAEGAFVGLVEWKGIQSLRPKGRDPGIPRQTDENGIWEWTWAPDDPVKLQIDLRGYIFREKIEVTGGDPVRTVVLRPAQGGKGELADEVFAPGRYDVYVLGDLPADFLTTLQHKLLAQAVQKGAGLIMLVSASGGVLFLLRSPRDGARAFRPIRVVGITVCSRGT